MAEFCLDCYNRLNDTKYRPRHVTLDDDFCEGCAQWTKCIATIHPSILPSWGISIRRKPSPDETNMKSN